MRWVNRIVWIIIAGLFLGQDINVDLWPLVNEWFGPTNLYTLAPQSQAQPPSEQPKDPLQAAIREFQTEFKKACVEGWSDRGFEQIVYKLEQKVRQLLYGRVSYAKRAIEAFRLINERYIFPFALRLDYLVEVDPEGFDRFVRRRVFTLHRIIRQKIKRIDGDEIKGYFVHEITPFEQGFLGRLGWSWAQSDYIVVSAKRIQKEDEQMHDYFLKEDRSIITPQLLLELFPGLGHSILRDTELATQIIDLYRQIYQNHLQGMDKERRIELQENNIFNHEAEHKRLRRKFKLKGQFRDSELSESLSVCRAMIEEEGDPFFVLVYELLKALDGDGRAWGFLSRLTGFHPQMPRHSKAAALNKLNAILKELEEIQPRLTKDMLVERARQIYDHAWSELLRDYVVGLIETPSATREVEAGI